MTSVVWASRAPAVSASAVDAPTVDSDRSISAAIDLTWLAASDEALTSVVWASRAPAVIELGGRSTGDRQRPFDIGGQRLDVVGGLRRGR